VTDPDLRAFRRAIEARLTLPALAVAAAVGRVLDDAIPGHGLDRQAIAAALAAAAAAGAAKGVSDFWARVNRRREWAADGPAGTGADADGCGPNTEWAAKGL